MTMTRDQLRAARMLLHLPQASLAELSKVGLATIKRFETGSEIRYPQLATLRRALEDAGAVLLDGPSTPGLEIGVGVALLPAHALPEATRDRIAAEERREAERLEAEQRRRQEEPKDVQGPRPRGRRPRTKPAAP